MAIASNLGFPRIGAQRELKKAVEAFWSGKLDEAGLIAAGKMLRQRHWQLQKQIGLQHIPSNDFSYYDHVLLSNVVPTANNLHSLFSCGVSQQE